MMENGNIIMKWSRKPSVARLFLSNPSSAQITQKRQTTSLIPISDFQRIQTKTLMIASGNRKKILEKGQRSPDREEWQWTTHGE